LCGSSWTVIDAARCQVCCVFLRLLRLFPTPTSPIPHVPRVLGRFSPLMRIVAVTKPHNSVSPSSPLPVLGVYAEDFLEAISISSRCFLLYDSGDVYNRGHFPSARGGEGSFFFWISLERAVRCFTLRALPAPPLSWNLFAYTPPRPHSLLLLNISVPISSPKAPLAAQPKALYGVDHPEFSSILTSGCLPARCSLRTQNLSRRARSY